MDEREEYLSRVRAYYDSVTPAVLESVGYTYQAAVVCRGVDDADPYAASNRFLADRAGIRPGCRVLDAGCGAGGPAVDIACAVPGVQIDGVTISSVQVREGQALVAENGLDDRVRLHEADYHALPFRDQCFDVAVFFESLGYAHSRPRIFSEVLRVLEPGGGLYIKDVFRKRPPLEEQEERELQEFDAIYEYRTPRLLDVIRDVKDAGFEGIDARGMNGDVTMEHFFNAMFERGTPGAALTDFGRQHFRPFQCLPVLFAEIRARKPLR